MTIAALRESLEDFQGYMSNNAYAPGKRLRMARHHAEVPQADFAAALDSAAASVGSWELGTHYPQARKRDVIYKATGLPVKHWEDWTFKPSAGE